MAPSHHAGYAPTLESFLRTNKNLDATIETAVALLKRRQIRGPEPCALATAHMLAQVVAKGRWADVDQLLDRVVQVGHKLADAQPHELVIGNIVRRVLGLIRGEAEADLAENGTDLAGVPPFGAEATTPSSPVDLRVAATTASFASSSFGSSFGSPGPLAAATPLTSSPSLTGLSRIGRQHSFPAAASPSSMFNLLSMASLDASMSMSMSMSTSSLGGSNNDYSATASGASTPVRSAAAAAAAAGATTGAAATPVSPPSPPRAPTTTSAAARVMAMRDEIIDGIDEIKDEIGQADDQIAGFAEAQIRPGDGVMVCELTRTLEKFLVKAAARRRYTLFMVGDSSSRTPSAASATFFKRLAAAKVPIVQVAGSAAVAAYMPRVQRVVLDARALAADGGVLAGRGGGRLARAAHAQGKTVLVVGGVYRLSPAPWTDPEALVEWGDPASSNAAGSGGPVRFADGGLVDGIEIEGALTEYLAPHLVDLYVTNLGPHSRDYLEGVVADHYRTEDLELCRQ